MKSELTNGSSITNKVALLLIEGARLPVKKRNTDVCNLRYFILLTLYYLPLQFVILILTLWLNMPVVLAPF